MQGLVLVFAAAQIHAIFVLNEERSAGVVQHEVGRESFVVHELLDKTQIQCRVATGLDGNPLVSLGNRGAKHGVDANELRASSLCISNVLPHLNLCANGVGTHQQNIVGVDKVLRFGLVEPLDATTGKTGVGSSVERIMPVGAAGCIVEAHGKTSIAVQ